MTGCRSPRLLALALAVLAVAGACGTTTTTTTAPSSDTPTTAGSAPGVPGSTPAGPASDSALPFGLARCDPDRPLLQADPAFYRDEPIYVGNEQPVEEVRAWAQTRPGYEDIWIDRDNNGWIAVGFAADAADRQAELEAAFPGVGVVAVAVTATTSELNALQSEIGTALAGLSSWGMGNSVARGLVEVSVPVLDEATLAPLAPFAGPLLCVDGAEPAVAVPDGPQPTGGEGWRLLGTDRTGDSYRTGVATDAEQYAALWREAGFDGEAPPVDFEAEIVIWFGAVYGGNCPIRLDDVVVDNERRIVHGRFVLPGNPVACEDDANPEAYVVAVPRDRLPEAPFAVQLDADEPPRGAPQERTTVQVDLRAAGATAAPADLVTGAPDDEGGSRRPEPFRPGLVIEAGYPWATALDLTCALDVLGPVNGVMWRATDPALAGGLPAAWADAADGNLAPADLLLTSEPPALAVTIAGTTIDYQPIPASQQATMSCP